MKGKLSTLAAAIFVASIGSSQPACVPYQTRVLDAIEQRDASIREDLDDILDSVFCIRTGADYLLDGAPEGTPTKSMKSHGTVFSYMHRDGYTYLVTNAHVVDMPEKVERFHIAPGPAGLELSIETYSRVSSSSSLVTNGSDSDASDDIDLEVVASDPEIDIAVVRTRKSLPVSTAYVFNPSIDPEVGEEAYVIGYPRAVLKTVTKGIISNNGHIFSDGGILEALDAAGTSGNSGSPYFIRRGERLYWSGLMNSALLHQSDSPMLSLTVPFRRFVEMLEDPEAYAISHSSDLADSGTDD